MGGWVLTQLSAHQHTLPYTAWYCLVLPCTALPACRYTLDDEPHTARHISMIAGGTGITPMYQVIQAVLKKAEDATQLSLLYANVSPDDILLREELDALVAAHPNFKVWYTGGWAGRRRRRGGCMRDHHPVCSCGLAPAPAPTHPWLRCM